MISVERQEIPRFPRLQEEEIRLEELRLTYINHTLKQGNNQCKQ